MPWPVEPNPPRAVEPPEPDEDVPVPLRPLENAVETEVGAEPRENHPPEWPEP
jgi:hypothetical protein